MPGLKSNWTKLLRGLWHGFKFCQLINFVLKVHIEKIVLHKPAKWQPLQHQN